MRQKNSQRCFLHALLITLLVTVAIPVYGFGIASESSKNQNTSLNETFERAAKDFNVPRDLLVAIAYVESRFHDRKGAPTKDQGYGFMHLVENPEAQTLATAARAINQPKETLKTDIEQNIRGGAAILSSYADEQGLTGDSRQDLAEWYLVVARYSNSPSDEIASLYADDIFKVLNNGFSIVTKQGETISVAAHAIEPKKGRFGTVVIPRSTDLPASRDLEPIIRIASKKNFSAANRNKDLPIRYIVIHTTQGAYAGTINWFQNPKARVSAHYVVRSSDGKVTQMVLEKDIAWHAGSRTYNQQGIGIEHEGFVDDKSWYTDAMYKSSAAVTRALCLKYKIPMDRKHIIGHYEVPKQRSNHTDPGKLWDWKKYMSYVNPSRSVRKSRGLRKKAHATRKSAALQIPH
jgi:N-acetyl-anhydromuramyl-L-alanine amidase AmpD